jgi:hypothetical protein
MPSLHIFAIFDRPREFGQPIKLVGFTRDTPEQMHLDANGHLALPLDNALATQVALEYGSETPEKAKALEQGPMALIIEGSLFEAGVKAYGPFLNADEALRHGWKIETIYRTTIISLENPDRVFVLGREVNLARLKKESDLYHGVMQDMRNTKLGHGRCMPRKDNACTHCAAQERLDKALNEYPGPRIVCS